MPNTKTSTKTQALLDAIDAAKKADMLRYGRVSERRVIAAVIDDGSDVMLAEIAADRERYGRAWQTAVASRKAADRKPPRDLGSAAAPAAADSAAPAQDAPPALPALVIDAPDPFLAERAAQIRILGKRVVADVIEIGRLLLECKDRCGHGGWLPWLEREFGWSADTAERFIRLNKLAGQIPQIAEYDIPVSGLYLLAAPSVTKEVRAEVIERASAGETLRHKEVKAIIAAHSPDAVLQAARALGAEAGVGKGRGFNSAVAMSPHAERERDLYETNPAVVRALLAVEPLDWAKKWECACGPGAIVRVLRDAGHHVVATDIESYGCPDALGGVDFLTQTAAPKDVTTIITNPPFMHADDFVRHALTLVPRVIMLLRLAFLESEGRSDILDGGKLARVYPFKNRLPMMHRANWDGPKIDSGKVAYAWFVWDREHRGPATLHRISWSADDAAPREATP